MSDALEQASLIMVPSGYEDGTLGSLKPLDGSGDFTFARCDGASECDLAATRVNEQGYIEKGYENLLLQSNSFLTTWATSTSASVSSGQTGYDGSSNAWLLSKTAASQYIQQQVSFGGINTFSVYIKAGTSNWVALMRGDGQKAFFDLSGSGSLGNVVSGITSKIESAGNGWFRCSFTFENSSTNYARIYPAEGNGDTSGTSGSIYIQDAMLNQGLVAYPYIETTTAPVAGGILEDMPRLDYSNGSCPALLLEPQRTNLVEHSEYFNDSSRLTITPNTSDTLSPEGLYNAAKLLSNDSGESYVNTTFNATKTKTTASVFVKKGDLDHMHITFYDISTISGVRQWFNTTTGVAGTETTFGSGVSIDDTSKELLGNGWVRISATATHPTSSALRVRFALSDADGNLNSAIGSYGYYYGFQVEQDATYPTSYIPTYGVSQTRLADNVNLLNAASFIGQTEGSYFIEWTAQQSDELYGMFNLTDGTNNNRVQLSLNDSGTTPRLGFIYVVNGTSAYSNVNIQDLVEGQTYKFAVTYTQSYLSAYLDGTQVINQTGLSLSGGVFNEIAYSLKDGSSFKFSKPVKQTIIFPTALSEDECKALTYVPPVEP